MEDINRREFLAMFSIGLFLQTGKTEEPFLVDIIEDQKGLGFPGQKKITIGSDRDLYLAYRKKSQEGIYLPFVSRIRQTIDGSWFVANTTTPINNSLEVHQRVPSLSVDGIGRIHLVWNGTDLQKSQGDRQIKYARSENRAVAWSSPKNVSLVEGYEGQALWQEHPDILAGRDNMLYAVWEGRDKTSKHQQIKFSRSSDGGETWSQWRNVKPSDRAQSRPTILQDYEGLLHISAYSPQKENKQQIWHIYSPDQGEDWSDWVNISQNPFDNRHVSAVVDNKNRLVTAWRAFNPPSRTAQIYCSFFNRIRWSQPIPVSPALDHQLFPAIGVDAANNTYIAWMETDKDPGLPNENPTSADVYYSVLRGDGGFFSRKILLSLNTFYTVLLPNSPFSDLTYIAYLKPKSLFGVSLSTLSLPEAVS